MIKRHYRHIPAGMLTTFLIWLVVQHIGTNMAWWAILGRMLITLFFSISVAFIWESMTNGKGEGVLQVASNPDSMSDIELHVIGSIFFLIWLAVYLARHYLGLS